MATFTLAMVTLLGQVDRVSPGFDFPGSDVMDQFISWALGIGLLGCVLGFVWGAASLWTGRSMGHSGSAARGKTTMALSFVGAILISATFYFINTAASIGGSL